MRHAPNIMVGEILRIYQSLAAFSEPRSEGEGLAFSLSPSRAKYGGCRGVDIDGYALKFSCQASEHLVVSPGVSVLGEGGLAAI